MMCQEKQCIDCLRFLPLGEFNKDKARKDGLRPHCKQCAAEYQRKYYEANKDKRAESKRKYYEANKEKFVESMRKWREANKEKVNERQRKYDAAKRVETAQTAVFRGLDKDKLKELKIKLEKLEK